MKNGWSAEELKASVEAYLEMRQNELAGKSYTKKRYYERLTGTFGRTASAFEYRMQNISYVLSLMGRSWVTGLKPAKNVGANIAAQIESFITQIEQRKSPPIAAPEIDLRKAINRQDIPKPKGNSKPKTFASEVTQFRRDESVRVWVLQQARGICDCCKKPAPFCGVDGFQYLEVHHVRHLADGGSDTVSNAVALCPNCHRELHYGAKAEVLVAKLYGQVTRLNPE